MASRKVAGSVLLAALLLCSELPGLAAFTAQHHQVNSRPALGLANSVVNPTHLQHPIVNRKYSTWSLRDCRTSFQKRRSLSPLRTSHQDDEQFDFRTTVSLVGGQSVLIALAALIAYFTATPNFGFGPGISFDVEAVKNGALLALPLGVFAALLDTVEERFPALKDVTMATQRSVLALMGGTFKPGFAVTTAIALGLAAGFGEEMLFRGILQYQLGQQTSTGLAVGLSSLIFGALHAVTPLYAALATLASVYFGALYLMTDNLAVPIACHAIYDVGALLFAHWTVTKMTDDERREIATWDGPTKRVSED
jgi:membrane protease YdiL (CAAX protease family)